MHFGCLQASQPVDVKSLLPEQKNIGAHMAALGILYPAQAGNRLFLSPTFMAGMLSGGKQCSAGSSVAGFIVVETSFRVYAYTTSPVQVCLPLMSVSPAVLHINSVYVVLHCLPYLLWRMGHSMHSIPSQNAMLPSSTECNRSGRWKITGFPSLDSPKNRLAERWLATLFVSSSRLRYALVLP